MYIKEIIIDGFKSYAGRTVLSGFDRSFNAITGLNGTGKSNILDAICFVLGISNLSQVRVNNLQELVFKQGQAGVTKASVTIIFDNRDKSQSPVGYEEYSEIAITRTVVIGGRNKYLINGHNAQLSRVQNLFHSVQLNVNNPHFLIMQGRITKVLNMKPPEILGMIEEAAGTRMFEMKKQSALKTIQKKDKKLEEIERVLQEDITPTLNKLNKEREAYIKWSQNNNEKETLEKFCIAYQYHEREELLANGNTTIEEMEEEIDDLRAKIEQCEEDLASYEKKIKKIKDSKREQMESTFKSLEKNVNELSKQLVKQHSVYQHKKESLESENEEYTKIKENIKQLEQTIKEKTEEQKMIDQQYEEKKKEAEQLVTTLQNLRNQLHSINAGIASSETGKTLTEQLLECKTFATNAATEAQQATLTIKHLEKELKEKKKVLEQVDNEYEELQQTYKKVVNEVKKLTKALEEVGFDEKKYKQLLEEKEQEQKIISKLKEEITQLSSELVRFNFHYEDPEPNFDRSKVKGLVANLFEIKDEKNSTALEVAAGSKLYNVVVENEKVAQQLIQKGKTKNRITVIPLNKIRADTLPSTVCKKAAEVAGGEENAKLALYCVDYDKDVEQAMKFVFGRTLICKDIDVAEQVAFHKDIKRKTVTLKGDSFDPHGSLTGGSMSKSEALKKLNILKTKQKELKQHEKQLARIIRAIDDITKLRGDYQRVLQQLELKKHEANLIKSRIEQSKHHEIMEACKAIEYKLREQQELRQKQIEIQKENEEKCKQIEHDMKHFSDHKDIQINQLKRDIELTKTKQEKAKEALKQKERETEKFNLELEEIKEELEELKRTKAEKKSLIKQMMEEFSKLEAAVTLKKQEYDKYNNELEKKKAMLSESDHELSELVSKKEQCSKEKTSHTLKLKKMEHKLERLKRELKDAKQFLKNIVKQHPWIKDEKHLFGKEGTDYDFKAKNPKEAQKMLNRISNEQEKLSKSVNKKVMNMYEKAEQEYQDLIKKRKIVEKDKKKIEQVIQEVDEKKNEAIKKTWEKVNKDFGSIFSTLLPGAKCKLVPPEGESVLDGLEVKVAFGNDWKDSLNELSGGQRSLLALSLILSLLLFKPAPMYILDEIDAALDPSHTQNIGRMLKTHFSNSQFIIVSLKEGMFNNANVVFRTKFVSGQSQVTRTVPGQNVLEDDEEEKENRVPSETLVKERTTKTKKRKRMNRM